MIFIQYQNSALNFCTAVGFLPVFTVFTILFNVIYCLATFSGKNVIFRRLPHACGVSSLCTLRLPESRTAQSPPPKAGTPNATAELLNSRKEKLICVRGNCDSEVDEMMLTFSCLNAYTTIVLSGHTHVTLMEEENGLFYFNPGSISLPKCEDGKTCGILEAGGDSVKVSLHSIDGKLIREMKV